MRRRLRTLCAAIATLSLVIIAVCEVIQTKERAYVRTVEIYGPVEVEPSVLSPLVVELADPLTPIRVEIER